MLRTLEIIATREVLAPTLTAEQAEAAGAIPITRSASLTYCASIRFLGSVIADATSENQFVVALARPNGRDRKYGRHRIQVYRLPDPR